MSCLVKFVNNKCRHIQFKSNVIKQIYGQQRKIVTRTEFLQQRQHLCVFCANLQCNLSWMVLSRWTQTICQALNECCYYCIDLFAYCDCLYLIFAVLQFSCLVVNVHAYKLSKHVYAQLVFLYLNSLQMLLQTASIHLNMASLFLLPPKLSRALRSLHVLTLP